MVSATPEPPANMFVEAVPRVHGRTPRRFGALWIAALIGISLLLAQTAFGHSLLRAAGISRQSTPFVALAFLHPNALPNTVPKSGQLPIEFSIRSVGLSTNPYAWQIVEDDRSGTVPLVTGRTVVPTGTSASIIRSVHVSCSGTSIEVAVRIKGSGTKIDMRLTC